MTLSHFFIAMSAIATLSLFLSPSLWAYGFNPATFFSGNFALFWAQVFLFQFLHGGFFHLMFNALFIHIFGNSVEYILGRSAYIAFFIFNALFIAWGLLVFSQGITIGISGFAMAVLAFFTLTLRERKNPEYKWWITALIINIIIGLHPQISLVGHLAWAISWIIFFLFHKIHKKKGQGK